MGPMPLCRRCLLQDTPDHVYYQSVLQYRRSLPDRLRCPDEEYARRLDACRVCDQLAGGVCAQCGCYVEMRAAAAAKHCPLKVARW